MQDFYNVIAEFYEQFQDFDLSNLPELWAEFLNEEFNKTYIEINGADTQSNECRDLLALDLGCGTGSITLALAKKDWRVIGIDNSPQMLEIANSKLAYYCNNEKGKEKQKSNELSAKFILQNLLHLNLDEKADLIYTSLDVFNHLDEDELIEALRKSYEQLKNRGVLIFDLHSLDYMKNDLGSNIYHSVTDDYAIIWENDFSDVDQTNEAIITTFKKSSDGRYKRENSSLREYYHYPKLIKDYLTFLGMEVEYVENTKFTDMWDGKRIFIKASKNQKA